MLRWQPGDAPHTDGTATWSEVTMVLVHACAGGLRGLGYTYESAAAATIVRDVLAPTVAGVPLSHVPAAAERMRRAVRNQGQGGVASCAIAAVETALWDLAARALGVPLAHLFGCARERVPVYASGGFTSSGPAALELELGRYVEDGHRRVKIKVGREPRCDLERVRLARDVLGPDVALMVDANGAYDRKQALAMAERFASLGVVWFEEPVSSDDVEGLRLLRDRGPAGMHIAAGEYGYVPSDFVRLLAAGAVDVLQADATRCQGPSGFLQAAALADARGVPLSSHCAPALHAQLAACVRRFAHLEWFKDHVSMEARVFAGAPRVEDGAVRVDARRPGLGLEVIREEVRHHVQ